MPTYRTNALYQAPTVDNAVYEQFGMQPGMDRLNLLPRHDAKLGWIAPNALYQIARALVSPGVAAQGGNVSPEDAVNFAGNVSLGSLGTSALLRNPAPGPGKTLPAMVYHGTAGAFDTFDPAKRGSLTGARSAKQAFWFTDDHKTAGAYAVHAAEDGPVKAALDKAATYERMAQKTGSQSWWDKYDAAIAEAESLDTYAARNDRRAANAKVMKVDIPDNLDLLHVDAGGKAPWEMNNADIDSWLGQQIAKAKAMGKAGVKFTNLNDAVGLSNQPATHYAIFDPSHLKVMKD